MQEIKLSIPDGCKTVIINLDGENITTQFEPREEKWKPKDGDIIACNETNKLAHCIAIFKYATCENKIIAYAGLNETNNFFESFGNSIWGDVKDYRPATEEEKQLLMDKLADAGYRWNAEEKKLEQLPRWRAKEEQEYFYITSALRIDTDNESMHGVDKLRYQCGNYFKTREAAERVAEQIRDIFKNSKAE